MPQSDSDITKDLNNIGLLGVWREDCSKPFNEKNFEMTYVVSPDGKNIMQFTVTGLPGLPRDKKEPAGALITECKVLSSSLFTLKVKNGYSGGVELYSTYTLENGVLQILEASEVGTGTVTIKNCKNVDSGQTTYRLRKCM